MHIFFRWVAVVGFLVGFGLSWAAGEEKPVKLSKEEQYLVDLTNEARQKEKLPALKVHPLLNKAAANYSQVLIKNAEKAVEMMAKKDKMVHELDGTTVGKRFDDLGYNYTEFGENVAVAYNLNQMKAVHDAWMKSKFHRDNIMDKLFAEIGLAVVKHPNRNEWYITQVFGTR